MKSGRGWDGWAERGRERRKEGRKEGRKEETESRPDMILASDTGSADAMSSSSLGIKGRRREMDMRALISCHPPRAQDADCRSRLCEHHFLFVSIRSAQLPQRR